MNRLWTSPSGEPNGELSGGGRGAAVRSGDAQQRKTGEHRCQQIAERVLVGAPRPPAAGEVEVGTPALREHTGGALAPVLDQRSVLVEAETQRRAGRVERQRRKAVGGQMGDIVDLDELPAAADPQARPATVAVRSMRRLTPSKRDNASTARSTETPADCAAATAASAFSRL